MHKYAHKCQRRQWHPTPVLLPGKSHGRRSLVGCGPWGCKELDTTERIHFHFSLSCIGEGNGNPLQCSCLENPRDGGAWWAAVSGVAQSRTRLKLVSSSSSSEDYGSHHLIEKEQILNVWEVCFSEVLIWVVWRWHGCVCWFPGGAVFSYWFQVSFWVPEKMGHGPSPQLEEWGSLGTIPLCRNT